MYRSILVPLDGSEFAEAAIPWALSIANRAGANLELVRVHELYALQDPHASWAPYIASEDTAFWEQEQAYLAERARRLRATATAQVTAKLLDGLVEEAILKHAQSKPVDLIVMAIHGRGPLDCFLAGSVAEGLVRHGSAPVLLVRPQEPLHGPEPEPSLKRLLIPLDGSELAERILEPAIALGSAMDAECILIRAVEPTSPLDGFAVIVDPIAIERSKNARTAAAQAHLDQVAERLRTRGLRTQTQVVVGKAADAIVEAARRQDIKLIALATHGRGGLGRFVLGSVADKVVRSAFTPVLVYRPHANSPLHANEPELAAASRR